MSRPWCSVIIPTLNEAAALPATLTALERAWPGRDEYEVIVVDGGSTDGTAELARRWGARTLRAPAGRAGQLNAGARGARGAFLFFLHADTHVPPDLTSHLRAAPPPNKVTEPKQAIPASFRIRFGQDDNFWLRLFGRLGDWNLSAFRFGDQGLFVAANLFRAVGGYREDHALLEDYELARRLRRRAGFRILPTAVRSSARRYERHGPVFTQLIYVLIFMLYRCGVSQSRLRAVYDRAFSGGTKVGAARKLPSAVHSNHR